MTGYVFPMCTHTTPPPPPPPPPFIFISGISEADPGFQVRGGGALKKNSGVFRMKNHDFTPKNHILSNCRGRRENFWGISFEKSRFCAKKSYFFQF